MVKGSLKAPMALLLPIPGVVAGLRLFSLEPSVLAFLSALAFVAAVSLVLITLEAARRLPLGLALLVATFAIALPEYSVEARFSWVGASPDGSEYASLALATTTGTIQLLIGVGWPLTILLSWLKNGGRELRLERERTAELSLLFLISLYAFTIYVRASVSFLDTVVLLAFFGVYVWRASRLGSRDAWSIPVGPGGTRHDGGLHRIIMTSVLVYASLSLFLIAGPFADGLVLTGGRMGVDGFGLVQLAAPLASKLPWFAILVVLAWNAQAGPATRTLLTAQMGQWTLVLASLPAVMLLHGLALGDPSSLALDEHQRSALLLTASQSLFLVTALSRLTASWRVAAVLFALFAAHRLLGAVGPGAGATLVAGLFPVVYIGAAILAIIWDRQRVQLLAGMFFQGSPSPTSDAGRLQALDDKCRAKPGHDIQRDNNDGEVT